MHTEEFVLVPRQMYSEEQPQVSQVLRNQNIANKSAYLSVLQRNQQSLNDAKAASSRVKYDATTAKTYLGQQGHKALIHYDYLFVET